MRVFKAGDFLPEGVHLFGTVTFDLFQRALLGDALAVFEDLFAQLHGAEIGDHFALPDVLRVKNFVRLGIVDDFVV